MTQPITPPSTRRILTATAIALGVAVAILFTAILPAEYGIDPLGTGRALGLTALAGDGAAAPQVTGATSSPPAAENSSTLGNDEYKVELRPFESVEYKYRLEQGRSLLYSWRATGNVEFEFHGEPDGAPARYFDSYGKGDAVEGSGVFTAAKAGVHGWYWKNPEASRITVTLQSAGFYSQATEYRDGDRNERKFSER